MYGCSHRKCNQQRLALKVCKSWCAKVHSDFPNAGLLEDKAGPKSHNFISTKVTTRSMSAH